MPDVLLETRTVDTVFELRDADTTAPVLEGYASTFSEPYDLGTFREQVDPAAFNRTLGASPDVRLLVDHKGQPLARTKSGTLELSADSRGLHMRSALDAANPRVVELVSAMRRGDLDQMSFGFRIPKGGDTWDNDLRTLRNIELNGGDVSVVTYPANPNTSASVRSVSPFDDQMVYLTHVIDECRAGAEISAANLAKFKKVLDLIAAADVAVDAAQPLLAGIIGVPNPDADDKPADGVQANCLPRDLAYRLVESLSISA